MTVAGEIKLPKMAGLEVSPGVTLIGEPSPIAGTNKLRCLANVGGALCLVELSFKFGAAADGAPSINAREVDPFAVVV